ncbi:hypothetical protein KAU11_09470, partial [Candidatus Babeliales bacterium]|nr:hypothetical protein [Candidatus Babeliales bacterium]
MEKMIFRKIVCMLVITLFVLPVHGVTADDSTGEVDISINIIDYTPLHPQNGDTMVISTKLMNNGTNNATNFTVTFLCDNPGTVIDTKQIQLLQAGASMNLSITWNAFTGDHIIIAMADDKEVVVETDEGNNEDDIILYVTGGTHNGEKDDTSNNDQDTKGSQYVNAWREAESWDRSWDSYYETEWDIKSSTGASNGSYTRQWNKLGTGDYAEWDFTVNKAGTYYFWVRAYHYSYECKDVRLFWNTDQIGSYQNWYSFIGSWEWTCFGSKQLDLGSGTLRIEAFQRYYIDADNLLITENPDYTPTDKGFEGSTSHDIGPPISQPHVEYHSHSIDDDNNGASSGNNNGMVNAGETIELTVTLKNTGDVNADGVYAYLSTDDPEITISDDYAYYGTITANGGTANGEYIFSVEMSHGVEDALFTLDIYDNDGHHWTDTFMIYIYGTRKLEYYDHTIDDDNNGDSSGNNDGMVNPGESIELKVTLINTGNIPANGVYAYLSTNDPLIAITDDYEEYPAIMTQGHPETCLEDFDFDVGSSHGVGAVEFTLDIYDVYDHHWTDTFNVIICEAEPQVEYESHTIDDDNNGSSSGDNNGNVNAGETIELTVTLKNTGSADSNDVEAFLSTDDPEITITDDYASYGTIPVDSTADGEYVFSVSMNHGVEDAWFTLDIYDNDGHHW